MKILIGYDGSKCADAALDDLSRAGLPLKGEAEILSLAEVWLPRNTPTESRVFNVFTSTVRISDLRISRGFSSGAGGGVTVESGGNLTLNNCLINGNEAESAGGVFAGSGAIITITNSTIAGNISFVEGGGVSNRGGTLMMTNTLIIGNEAPLGGGVAVDAGGTATILNSTIAANGNAGGSSGEIGGLWINGASTVNLKNTIVAKNIVLGTSISDVGGTVISQGNNLIGNTTGGTGFIASDLQNVDPQFGGFAVTNSLSPFVVALDGNAPTAAPALISGRVTAPDGAPLDGVVMTLAGSAGVRRTITDSQGFYQFADAETGGFYIVSPLRANYSFAPAERSFSLLADRTDAVFTATLVGGAFDNPLDTPGYFVRQHYLDFLGREPDESGFNFWSDQILSCSSDAACIERRAINVSAAYFLSIEFQQTGGLVDGLYRLGYGVRPNFAEFMPDTRAVAQDVVAGREGWQAKLEANKRAFVAAFVNRPAFRTAFDGLSNEDYVETLISHTGVSFTSGERNALVSGLLTGTMTRADVLRSIADNQRFVNAKFSETFVMMEYFGYLRRDPDESGFQFWLNKLNQFGGNFEQAEMVKAFIVSGEYRDRFPR